MMSLLRELFKAIAIKLGFIVDPAMNPLFRYRQRKTNLLLFIALLIYLPLSHFFLGTVCVVQSMIGVPCPACGSTRAFRSLLKGHVSEALYWHPLIFLSLIIFFSVVVISLRDEIMKQRAFQANKTYTPTNFGKKFRFVFTGILIIYLIVYIYRLIRLYPQPPLNYNEKSILGRILNLIHLLLK